MYVNCIMVIFRQLGWPSGRKHHPRSQAHSGFKRINRQRILAPSFGNLLAIPGPGIMSPTLLKSRIFILNAQSASICLVVYTGILRAVFSMSTIPGNVDRHRNHTPSQEGKPASHPQIHRPIIASIIALHPMLHYRMPERHPASRTAAHPQNHKADKAHPAAEDAPGTADHNLHVGAAPRSHTSAVDQENDHMQNLSGYHKRSLCPDNRRPTLELCQHHRDYSSATALWCFPARQASCP